MDGSSMPVDVRFGLLWGDAHSAVAGYIQGLVGDRTTADDLVQETALAAFRSFASYDATRSFTAWTLGVARHLVHQHWEALARKRPVFRDVALIEELADIAIRLEEPMSARHEALRECLRSVEGRSWEVVRLHYVDGLTTGAIGKRLGLAGGNVRVLLHRIRAALRTCIERRLATEAGHGG